MTSSIVDVSGLAGSRKTRRFSIIDQESAPVTWGNGATLELWDRSCKAVSIAPGGLENVSAARFKIPKRAAWMTVTSGAQWTGSSFGAFFVRWELR